MRGGILKEGIVLTCGDKGIATLSQDLHQVVSEVPTGQIQAHDGMGQGVPFVDGDIVCHTITRVQHDTCGNKKQPPETQPRKGPAGGTEHLPAAGHQSWASPL